MNQKHEIVAKLKLPMPINDGLRNVTHGLEQLYGKCFVNASTEFHELGWFIITRKTCEVPSNPPLQRCPST